MPLQRTAKLDYQRRTTAVTRKNIGVPTYDTEVLYNRDWQHVKIMQKSTGKIPTD